MNSEQHAIHLARRRARHAGLSPEERTAHLEKRRAGYHSNPEPHRLRAHQYRELNLEKCREKERLNHAKHRETRNAYSRAWHEKHKDEQRLYRAQNKTRYKQWCLDNADHIKRYQKEYVKKTINARRQYKRNYNKIRRLRDPAFKILCNLRSRLKEIRRSGGIKCKSTSSLTGCSMENLRMYLESKFKPGMSWENYGKGVGKWHIDHILPCAIFDLTNPVHQRWCFHFSNLRPLWGIENMSKGSKILTEASIA